MTPARTASVALVAAPLAAATLTLSPLAGASRENEMKWERSSPTQGTYDWARDQLRALLRKHITDEARHFRACRRRGLGDAPRREPGPQARPTPPSATPSP
jgi:hypothetical protein